MLLLEKKPIRMAQVHVMVMNWFRKKLYGNYQIRFETLYDYNEKDHSVYIQLALENSVNFCKHENISHGIFVQNGKAKVAFLEYSKTKEE